jgi:phage shock protein B
MEDTLVPILIVGILFLGLPWLIFHYVTKWKSSTPLTGEDEKLLEDLHEMARRLDDRLCTIERIMNAENPNWQQTCLPDLGTPLDDDVLKTTSRARTRSGEKA